VPAAPASALPATEEDDTNSPPPTTTPEPEPLAAKPVEPAPATSAAVTADAATSDRKRIHIASDPPGARMFWRGKEVGTTPFTLELQPGEKHSYELGLPGYVTRKVVIDGSKSEISIGMKPESRAATGASPRK
jgi:serine/threonine-protein kinase